MATEPLRRNHSLESPGEAASQLASIPGQEGNAAASDRRCMNRKSEVGSQRSEVRGQRSEVRSQKSENDWYLSDCLLVILVPAFRSPTSDLWPLALGIFSMGGSFWCPIASFSRGPLFWACQIPSGPRIDSKSCARLIPIGNGRRSTTAGFAPSAINSSPAGKSKFAAINADAFFCIARPRIAARPHRTGSIAERLPVRKPPTHPRDGKAVCSAGQTQGDSSHAAEGRSLTSRAGFQSAKRW